MIVTGIGQCSLDYLALVDTYPSVDTKQEVLRWVEQGGGPVATALVALSRLGVKCRFVGVVGDDHQGEKIRRSLIDEGVDVEGLVTRRGMTSQVAFIAVEKGTGKRTIFWKRPQGEALRPVEFSDTYLRDSDFLLLDGLMADVSLLAAMKARKHGVPTMLDGGRVRSGMLQIASLCDYLVASWEFARDLGWRGDPEAFRTTVRTLGAKVVTITLGDRGSITYMGDELLPVPAFDVKVIDTTGAGDVFHGGYVFGLLKGWEIERVIRFASAVAAMKCREMGGRAGIPDLPELVAFLRERGYAYDP